mgnify:CR=1 FL=1
MEKNITNIDSLILSFLERTISSEELQALRKWVKESAENETYFRQFEESWLVSAGSAEKSRFHKEQAYKNFVARINSTNKKIKSRTFPLRKVFYYAACVLLIFMAGKRTSDLFFGSSPKSKGEDEFAGRKFGMVECGIYFVL